MAKRFWIQCIGGWCGSTFLFFSLPNVNIRLWLKPAQAPCGLKASSVVLLLMSWRQALRVPMTRCFMMFAQKFDAC
ncbi:MAG: hypothetical protein ACK4P4_08425 [Allorhizobium sp.]